MQRFYLLTTGHPGGQPEGDRRAVWVGLLISTSKSYQSQILEKLMCDGISIDCAGNSMTVSNPVVKYDVYQTCH